jgi:DNA helicase MCM8
MGKSQMLLAASQLATRSVYVGGNTASATGLTVTLTKEEGGETGIEAGALVLADQGVACIDELDKCKHLDGLLEAMEQQQVSIAKAGVVASLPARCSIVAAANPKHGSYSMSKTVAENLNISRPVLSRFDLVFILRDRADKEQVSHPLIIFCSYLSHSRASNAHIPSPPVATHGILTTLLKLAQDRLVSSNIMNLYRKGASNDADTRGSSLFSASQSAGECQQSDDSRVSLAKRLAWVAGFNEPLPAALVRDYIAYAREFCKPKLTEEAAVVLKDYYMSMRSVLEWYTGLLWLLCL